MSLAYLLGKTSAKFLKLNINIPLILVLSIIPDIDIVVETVLNVPFHRGPTHSVIFAVLVFVPFFIFFSKRAVPYFLSLVSHSLLADFFIGGNILLLWPLSESDFGATAYGFSLIRIIDPVNVSLELGLFIVALVIMLRYKDFLKFFKANYSNLLLVIPVLTVLLPTFTSYPLPVPNLLIFPHLFFLILFVVSGLFVIKKFLL
jgi:hypothetical protein